jgi:hypothetical protein
MKVFRFNSFSGFSSRFLVYYGPWWRHVNDYHALEDQICFVSYEDLLTVCEKINFMKNLFSICRIFVQRFVE